MFSIKTTVQITCRINQKTNKLNTLLIDMAKKDKKAESKKSTYKKGKKDKEEKGEIERAHVRNQVTQ